VIRIALAALAATVATPVSGSVFGPITAVKGTTFTLTTPLSPNGKSVVSVGSATVLTEQLAATRASLKTGACVSAMGARNAKGVVAAQRISISAPVKGVCGGGFARVRTGRPAGAPPPGGGFRPRSGNFGFAFGKITAVQGATLTVSDARGATKVTVSAKTALDRTARVAASALASKLCAFVYGTSTDKGLTVKAERIMLSREVGGTCRNGFRRGP
jgi:Domain of unknown function (DUF5666)